MATDVTQPTPAELAEKQANQKIVREIAIAIGGMMLVAIGIAVIANTIA